jgi:hypothetical protein
MMSRNEADDMDNLQRHPAEAGIHFKPWQL